MAKRTKFLNLKVWENSDRFSPEDLQSNWEKIDAQFNPLKVADSVIPDDIAGLNSSQIDDLFDIKPQNGTVRLAVSGSDVVIISRINNKWYKTANLSQL